MDVQPRQSTSRKRKRQRKRRESEKRESGRKGTQKPTQQLTIHTVITSNGIAHKLGMATSSISKWMPIHPYTAHTAYPAYTRSHPMMNAATGCAQKRPINSAHFHWYQGVTLAGHRKLEMLQC